MTASVTDSQISSPPRTIETRRSRVVVSPSPSSSTRSSTVRSGAMAAHSPVMREVVARAKGGVPVLGICNGFQILCECGLLPGVLMRNAGLRFVCRDVHLRVETTDTPFTASYRAGQTIRVAGQDLPGVVVASRLNRPHEPPSPGIRCRTHRSHRCRS